MKSIVILLIVAPFLPCSLCGPTEIKHIQTGDSIEDEEPVPIWLHHGNSTKCYPPIGCLVTTDEWYSPKRPLNPIPPSREKVGTNFKLYTRENQNGEVLEVDENEDVQSRYFKSDRDTKFIIHGFRSKGSADWTMNIMEALLQRMDVNVVIVDWSKGASTLYAHAATNTRLVGLEIAYLINMLIEKKGASAENFHLIGHSLGSHTAGYAGERIDNLGRITGLDPAGLYFEDMPIFIRLDPSDAVLVDVIHTDGKLGFGTSQELGHLDFYPNGGKFQPGCAASTSEFPSCSHSRSEDLFLESILSSPYYEDGTYEKCPFISFGCKSYRDFLNGKCFSCGDDEMNCALMGLDADKYPGLSNPEITRKNFFLRTNSAPPYCGYHYHINLTLAEESEAQDEIAGNLTLTATGEDGITMGMPLTITGSRTFAEGNSYNFLGFSPVKTGKVSSAGVKWEWNPNSAVNRRCNVCNRNLFLSEAEVTNMGYYPQDKFKTSRTCNSSVPKEINTDEQYHLRLQC